MAYRRRIPRTSDPVTIGRRTYGIKVNHLPQDMSKEELKTLFQRFGSIADVSLKPGSGECYAFVNFHSNSCAHEAVSEMNGKVFHGKRINCKVQVEEIRSPSVGGYTVKVTFVSKNTTEATLAEVFGFGNQNCIQSVRMVPCSTGFIYNYAYVNYFYSRDAEKAVAELDQCLVDGCAVRVKLHTGQVGSPSADAPIHRVASYSGGHAPAVVPQPGSPSLATQRHMSRAISQPAFAALVSSLSSTPGHRHVPVCIQEMSICNQVPRGLLMYLQG
ncbi:Protein sex-lethal, partial [Geodia barretti]